MRDLFAEIFRPAASVLIAVCTALGAFSFFSHNYVLSAAIVIGAFLLALSLRAIYVAREYYLVGILPIKIKATQVVPRYDDEAVMLILEKRPWIELGHVFTLELLHDKIPENLGLIVVESRIDGTQEPAAIILSVSKSEVEQVVLDQSHLKSLQARPLMRMNLFNLPRRIRDG